MGIVLPPNFRDGCRTLSCFLHIGARDITGKEGKRAEVKCTCGSCRAAADLSCMREAFAALGDRRRTLRSEKEAAVFVLREHSAKLARGDANTTVDAG